MPGGTPLHLEAIVELAVGYTFNDNVALTGSDIYDPPITWWPLSDADGKSRLLSFTTNRGRKDVTDKFEPGTATMVLDNADGALDELDPNSINYGPDGGAGTPIRISVLYQPPLWKGVGYRPPTGVIKVPVFTGYVQNGWTPSVGGDHNATVTVAATDWLGWAGTVQTSASLMEWGIRTGFSFDTNPANWRPPMFWINGRMTAAGVAAGDGGYAFNLGSPAGSVSGDTGGVLTCGYGLALGIPSIVKGAKSPAISLRNSSLSTTAVVYPGYKFDVILEFSVTTPGGTGTLLSCVVAGQTRWTITVINGYLGASLFDTTGAIIGPLVEGYLGSTAADQAAGHGAKVDDGRVHRIVVNVNTYQTYDPSNGGYYSGGGFSYYYETGGSGGSGGLVTQVIADSSGYIATTGNDTINIQNAAIFPHGVVGYELVGGAMTYTGRGESVILPVQQVAFGASAFDRIAGVIAAAGVSTNVDGDSSNDSLHNTDIGFFVPGGNLAADVEGATDALAGVCWVRRGGSIHARGYPERTSVTYNSSGDSIPMSSGSSTFADTPIANITDELTPTSPTATVSGFNIRYSESGTTGLMLDRVINQVNVNSAITTIDSDSQARYGVRPLTINSSAPSAVIQPFCNDIVRLRKSPTFEIGKVTLYPFTNSDVATFVLLLLELDNLMYYTETNPANGHKRLDHKLVRVQNEAWTWNGGSDWKVVIGLAVPTPAPVSPAPSP